MKRVLIILGILFAILNEVQAQTNYSTVPSTHLIGDSKIDSILNMYPNKEYLIYLPSDQITDICSILILNTDKCEKYWGFRNDSLIFKGRINSTKIFKYSNYRETGVTKYENPPLKFIAPLMCQETDIETIIFKNNKLFFYFEYGNTFYHRKNEKKIQYRKKWLEIIRKELKNILIKNEE